MPWGRGFGRGLGLGYGRGFGLGLGLGMGFRRGPWPGAGPFSGLPPWQRPGWLYGRRMGRGMFNPYFGYGGFPGSMGYGFTQYGISGQMPSYPPIQPSPDMMTQSMQPPTLPYGSSFNPYSMNRYPIGVQPRY
ncbi:hypothetical protein [[Eubacterium] cellulosolvens]